jgi:Ca-activated chloride channel family protein
MMTFINDLHFIRPLALLALPIVLFIVWRLLANHSRDDGWSKICDPHLLDAIKANTGRRGSKWHWLLWPISIIAIISIAGPAFRKLPTPVIKNQSALIIVFDVSKSMLADDIKPNRLERAKYKINDILEKRKDGQTALVVYAGDAFVVTPLSDDTETISLMLKAINPNIMPVQGSRVDIALNKSQELLKQAGYLSGDIIVISDSVNLQRSKSIAQGLTKDRIYTSVLAIGTEAGAPIPTQKGFVKDKSGNIVIPKIDINSMRKLAASGNGRFSQISGDSSDIEYLLPKIVDNNNQRSEDEDAFDTEKYIDEGSWLTLLLIPLFVLLFRKGLLLGMFLVIGLQTPQPSYAYDWSDLWLNADQKAARQIQDGKNEQAYNTAKSDNWKATAAFRKKDYQQAQELFADGSADGYYNQGNALAQSGKLQEAIEAYDQALKINPGDEDSIYNKKQVQQALEKQKQQEQQDKDNKDQQQDEKDKQDKQDQKDSQNQESQDDQKDQQQNEGDEKQQGEQNQKDNPEEQQKESEQSEMSEEEKKQQEEKQKELEQADQEQKEQEAKQQEVQLTPEEMAENAENKEAIEQWLRRIPDDPGGLLRRKFYYQYNQQKTKPDETEDW